MDKRGGGSSKEQNPNVQFGVDNRDVQNQSNRPQRPNHAVQIENTGHIGSSNLGTRPVSNSASSSRGTMSNQRNGLDQNIDGTRPAFNPGSSSLGTMPIQSNVLGQGETPPGSTFGSSSVGMMSIGQGTDGSRPMVNAPNLNIVTRFLSIVEADQSGMIAQSIRDSYTRHRNARNQRLSSSGVDHVTHNPRPTQNQYQDPIQVLNNMSYPIPPYVPRHARRHNLGIQSRPYVITRAPPVPAIMVPPRVGVHTPMPQMVPPPTDSMRPPVVRMMPPTVQMRPPVAQMVPPIVEMRPPVAQMVTPMVPVRAPMVSVVPPVVQVRLPAVQVVPRMVQMRPPMGQTDGQRGYVNNPARPPTNMGVRPGGGVQQGSNRDETTSRSRKLCDDEAESSSNKRLKK